MILILVISFTRYLVCSNNDSGVILLCIFLSDIIYLLSTVTQKDTHNFRKYAVAAGSGRQEKYLDSTKSVICAYLSLF